MTDILYKDSNNITLPVYYDALHYTERKHIRDAYIKAQSGLCQHCKSELIKSVPKHIRALSIDHRLFPKHFFAYPIHLHHDHDSGLTIGVVHAICNAVLWQYHGE